MFCENS